MIYAIVVSAANVDFFANNDYALFERKVTGRNASLRATAGNYLFGTQTNVTMANRCGKRRDAKHRVSTFGGGGSAQQSLDSSVF